MSFTNAGAKAMLDAMFTTWGATLYIGLSSTTPTEAGGNITEPSGGGYARVATTAADWAAATTADPSVRATNTAKTFAAATADWLAGADMTDFVLFDAASGGTCVAFDALTTPKPVLNGDTASFASGDLSLTLD